MIVAPTAQNIDRAARSLRDGALVSFPTETVYGLGADARNPAAVRRIFAAKRRPAEHPVIVHIASASALPRWARSVPAGARALAGAFWPGPLTLILPRAGEVGDTVTGGEDNVGLRVPNHPVAQALLQRFAALGGDGIAAPSANRFGRVSATTAQHVADDFGDAVALILDGGACPHGIESTIVAFATGEPTLLRLGAIPVAKIAAVLGKSPRLADRGGPRAPGTLASHYAPQTPARLVPSGDLLAALGVRGSANAHIAVLAHSVAQPPAFEGAWFDAPAHDAAYARDLYANLRALDALAADEIWIEAPPDGPEWSAVHDRLRRATHRD
jgi:L-threonylcarbamoyladenylate synthase